MKMTLSVTLKDMSSLLLYNGRTVLEAAVLCWDGVTDAARGGEASCRPWKPSRKRCYLIWVLKAEPGADPHQAQAREGQ